MKEKIPLKYYGGKYRIAEKIIALFPIHKIYCEPFCGGASVFWRKAPSKIEILNDHDERLIAVYRCMQNRSEEFLKKLKYTPYSEAEFKRARYILENCKNYSTIDIAWSYFVNINQGFSGRLRSGWCRDKKANSEVEAFLKKKKMLKQFFKRLEKVKISCCDAISCIDYWDSEDTLFYLDPPYPEANQGHYCGYTIDDFNSLCEKLDTIQGSFLLSCYEKESMKTSKKWEKFQIKTFVSAKLTKRADRTEIIFRKINNKMKERELFI